MIFDVSRFNLVGLVGHGREYVTPVLSYNEKVGRKTLTAMKASKDGTVYGAKAWVPGDKN
jgi:hypothetical protein